MSQYILSYKTFSFDCFSFARDVIRTLITFPTFDIFKQNPSLEILVNMSKNDMGNRYGKITKILISFWPASYVLATSINVHGPLFGLATPASDISAPILQVTPSNNRIIAYSP